MRKCLQLFSINQVGVDLGGFNHRGRSHFTCEFLALVYGILFLILFFKDIEILKPALRRDISQVSVDHGPRIGFIDPTVAEFHRKTNLTISLTFGREQPLNCSSVGAHFILARTQLPFYLHCRWTEPNTVSFTLPMNTRGEEEKIFALQKGLNVMSQNISVDCYNINDCLSFHRTFDITISYNRIMPSLHNENGIDFVYNEVEDFYRKTQVFKAQISTREYRRHLVDEYGTVHQESQLFSIDRDPYLQGIYFYDTVDQSLFDPHFGDIRIFEDQMETIMRVQMESVKERMAWVVGYNVFWLTVFYCLFRHCVYQSFRRSLRLEIEKPIDDNDEGVSRCPLDDVRDTFINRDEDKRASKQIDQHLSLKNLYQVTKVVRFQNEKIRNQQHQIEKVSAEILSNLQNE